MTLGGWVPKGVLGTGPNLGRAKRMDDDTAAGRPLVQLLVDRDANRRQLDDWLTDYYDVEAEPDGSVPDALARCDLCVVDSRTVRQHRDVLKAGREASEPVFLPVLVLLTGAGQGDQSHWAVADDLVETPVRQEVLRHRIDVLLRARQYSLDLKRRNARLERFAGIVTHDLRNPLNIAQGFLDSARESGDGEDFERVERALVRMETIIDDVLELSRMGQTIGERDPVGLAEVANDAWAAVATDESTLTLDFGQGASVEGNESRVIVLFENLFRNAIEHAGPDVAVSVGPLEAGDGLYVEDDGPGIPAEDRDTVFEYGNTTTDGGTGFGLTIVRAIVHAHDWSIRVTDGRAGGARFEISFDEEPDRFPAEPAVEDPRGSSNP